MNIKVTDKWYLKSDPLNIIVAERKVKENPKPEEDPVYFVNKTFHSTIEQALASIFEEEVKRSKVTSFAGLQKVVTRQNELLEAIAKELKIKVR